MRAVLVVAIVLAAAPAAAQKFEYGKYDEVKDVKDVEWKATAEAGIVFTTGNSETTTATGGLKVSRKDGKNKVSLSGSGTYARSALWVLLDKNGNSMIDDESELVSLETTTAETVEGKLRYDRFLTDLNSVFVAALGSRDVPAGKDLVVGGQVGYSRSLFKSEAALTLGEFGYDYAREDLVTGNPVSIHSLRAFVGHKATMTEGADLDASIELLSNVNGITMPTGPCGTFDDTRVNMKIAISAKIGANLAVQTSLEAKYDRCPGPLGVKGLAMGFVPEASSFDTIMKGSLIYTFVGANK